MTSEVIKGQIRLLFLTCKKFCNFFLNSNLIKTIYKCYNYERQSFFIKMSMTSKVMKGHIRPV